MLYKYYDPPLRFYDADNFYIGDQGLETRATIDDILKLEQESESNGDLALASIDYELHFGLTIPFNFSINDHTLDDREYALEYKPYVLSRGGRVAVYRECIKRNIDADRLLNTGAISADEANEEDWCAGIVTGQIPIEESLHGPRDECITYLKKKREEILEWQRQHQQAQ